ncbi:ABC transporter ATP-binding protein [Cellulomonas carbonis]|uniref:ABC transporter ATP-binding protein n=1 Tax=Cellulomonas carbonis TaxID=1386092 RepID=UPI001663A8FA|nr:ABC transporter ATP-binding protein [Cellulomonas carbonis]
MTTAAATTSPTTRATSSSCTAVHVERLTVRPSRSARRTLDGVDLAVPAGGSLLVVGPSGGGKSTLLHVLAGVVPHSAPARVDGTVRVLGADPRTQPVARTALRVARLGQDPVTGTCLPRVADEVALGLESRGVPRAEIGARVRRALDEVGAAHLGDRRTGRLSGGEQQRVALAAALVVRPGLLLLDEPTAMLDPVAADAVRRVVAARATSGDVAVVVVEQRLEGWLPDRAVRLEAGTVVADGPTSAVVPAAPGPGRVARARPGTGDVVVDLSDLVVTRDGEPVVRVGRLAAREGQVTALVGRNGSGKSSLLLGIAGLLPCRGRREAGTAAYVAQHPEHQLLTRSVADEVAYGLAARGRGRVRWRGGRASRGTGSGTWHDSRHPTGPGTGPGAGPGAGQGGGSSTSRRARPVAEHPEVARALSRAGLTHLADADPFRLSGGEQRRLVLAAAGVLGRRVLLLDEPTAGLDAAHTARVVRMVADAADDGVAVVLATHDLALARAVADQVVVLDAGRSVAAGGPELLDDGALLVASGLAVGT